MQDLKKVVGEGKGREKEEESYWGQHNASTLMELEIAIPSQKILSVLLSSR